MSTASSPYLPWSLISLLSSPPVSYRLDHDQPLLKHAFEVAQRCPDCGSPHLARNPGLMDFHDLNGMLVRDLICLDCYGAFSVYFDYEKHRNNPNRRSQILPSGQRVVMMPIERVAASTRAMNGYRGPRQRRLK